jgi:uncharacterized protein DUF6542
MLIVVVAATLGAIATVVTKRDPGSLLGWCIMAGTLIAALAVRPRSAYLLIPVPALAYVVFGLAAGLIRNQANPSDSGLAVSAAQWVANGFLAMAAATVLTVVIALVRWFLSRRTAASSPAGRRRAGSGARRGPDGPLDRAGSARSVQSDSSGVIEQGDEVGFSGQPGWGGRDDRTGRDDRRREESPGRPKPAFYPNPDWPGDRGGGRDPRDRRPPPGPPSFGASRDLARRARSAR